MAAPRARETTVVAGPDRTKIRLFPGRWLVSFGTLGRDVHRQQEMREVRAKLTPPGQEVRLAWASTLQVSETVELGILGPPRLHWFAGFGRYHDL
ncbi:MAG TPA: hypothetical protein VNI01_05195 [Elusimicrobiota bacterium]|jgi:hypothetical protein|nr:hypothetical protein [Elusimicrobiota bacterium]